VPNAHPLEEVLHKAIAETDGDKVSVGDILELFEHRSFAPVFTLAGLSVVIPPLGAIPILPAIVGLMTMIFSVQIVIGRSYIWMPDWIRSMAIDRQTLKKAAKRSESTFAFIDQMFTERLVFLTGDISTRLAAGLITLLAALLIPLELVPFAVAVPGVAISLFGLALLARDGAIMLLAFLTSGFALTLAVWLLLR